MERKLNRKNTFISAILILLAVFVPPVADDRPAVALGAVVGNAVKGVVLIAAGSRQAKVNELSARHMLRSFLEILVNNKITPRQ